MSAKNDIDFAPAPVPPADFREWQNASRAIEDRTVVFIAGPQRTGTTWLTRCLHAHPIVVSRCEGHGVTKLLAEAIPAIERFNAELPDHSPYCRIPQADLPMLARQLIDRQLLHYISDDWRPPEKIRVVVDKTPAHATHLHTLDALYPWAKFIFCVRDPRDAAVSWWKLMRRMGRRLDRTIEDSVLLYAEQVWGPMVRAGRSVGEQLGTGRFLETSFERRVEDPGAEMVRILKFLGVGAEAGTVETCLEAGALDKIDDKWIKKLEAESGETLESKYNRGSVGNWTGYLAPDLAAEVRRRAFESAGQSPVASDAA